MKTAKYLSVVLSVSTLLASPASYAQAGSGKHRDILVSALEQVADGECSSKLMSVLLQDTCDRQMPSMGQFLKQRGKIVDAIFKGTQSTPSGPVEVYRVKFQQGDMTWLINTGSDGKITVLWSGG